MTCKAPAILALLLFVSAATPAYAQHGGHAGGGFSGHSTGSGHSSGFHSSAHSSGQGGGRSSGGSYAHGSSRPPLAGAAMVHGHVIQLPHPGFGVPQPSLSRRPLLAASTALRRGFGFLGFAGLGFCGPFSGYSLNSFYANDCFSTGFFGDPYLANEFAPNDYSAEAPDEPDDSSSADAEGLAEFHPGTIVSNDPVPAHDTFTWHKRSPNDPETLLQLKTGAMYGLVAYSVEGDHLTYRTDYGGQNTVPLAQIDLDKTNQLNADRGVRFSVQPSPNQNSIH
jgi:hypothetical protein